MTKRVLSEKFEVFGEWSLPESNLTLAGTLSWDSEAAYLQLNGSFSPMHGAIHAGDTQRYSVIHGISTNSNFFTVLRALRANAGISFGPAGIRQSDKLHSTWVISGAHVTESTLFKEIRVRIPGLQIWIGRSGTTLTTIEKTETTPVGFVYYIEGLPEESFEIPSIDSTLGWGIDRNLGTDMVSEVKITSSACLKITPQEPQNLDWFLSEFGKATTLLSFLAASPMSPDHIDATLLDDTHVDVLVGLNHAQRCEYKNHHDFFMLRNDMGIGLDQAFTKWFEVYDSVAKPSQLALSIFSSDKLWLHVEFLSVMQALEGFHRANFNGLYTSENEYKKINNALTQAIPNTVDADHKASLKSRIKFGNEISLRKRLTELMGRLDLKLRKFILGGDGSFPQIWVDTRNYYTHWDEVSASKILDGYEMHKASFRMSHLLRALYLDLVGIPQEAILKALTNASSASQYLIQINNMEYRAQNPNDDSGAFMRISKTPAPPQETQP